VLSIHRSTLKYRLKRVRELLGQDLNDGSTRLDLHLPPEFGSRLTAFAGPSKPDQVKGVRYR
jgi:PucR C-terminal helix-turn-helix domain